MTTYKMPAGTYYIGDLCYVLDDIWDDVCDVTQCNDGKFKLPDGREFIMLGTAFGDGQYPVFGHSKPAYLAVDSGTIGCIKWDEGWEMPRVLGHGQELGIKVDFPEDFEVENNDYTLTFGHIEVPTGDEEDLGCIVHDDQYNDEEDEDTLYDSESIKRFPGK